MRLLTRRPKESLLLLLASAVIAALTVYSGMSKATGQQSATATDSMIAGEINVQSTGMYGDGTFRSFNCKADGLVVVSDAKVTEIKARNPSLAVKVGDAVAALSSDTGATFLSLNADGSITKGTRDCVEVKP